MRIVEIGEKEIKFDNGYVLSQYHDQDCCEQVYADFELLKQYNVSTITGKTIHIKSIDFEENIEKLIEEIENMGFNMVSKIGEKFFVPCYNIQNGYYSDSLELILEYKEVKDISNCARYDEV